MFMGWQDPVGSPPEAIRYFEAMRRATPGAVGFSRLYMVPGMAHCAGGPGATHFSNATRDSAPPVSDAAHDMAVALEDWVEKGAPPRALIATHYASEKAAGAKGERRIAFQRPLCPYPQVARYRGGPPAEASSFVCAVPKPARKG
jgi:feruloyl esterase